MHFDVEFSYVKMAINSRKIDGITMIWLLLFWSWHHNAGTWELFDLSGCSIESRGMVTMQRQQCCWLVHSCLIVLWASLAKIHMKQEHSLKIISPICFWRSRLSKILLENNAPYSCKLGPPLLHLYPILLQNDGNQCEKLFNTPWLVSLLAWEHQHWAHLQYRHLRCCHADHDRWDMVASGHLAASPRLWGDWEIVELTIRTAAWAAFVSI